MPKFAYENQPPRIVKLMADDTESESCIQPRHCDVVVTVLEILKNDCPSAMQLFFDPKVTEFACFQHYKDDRRKDEWFPFVSRRDKTVSVRSRHFEFTAAASN